MRAPRIGLLLALVAAASLRAEEIAFGILGTDSAAALRQNWNPFLADMAKETGLEVRGYFATDYAGLVEAMRFGKVQLAWLGNKAAIEAVDRAEAEVFAQFVDLAGRSGYHAHLIVHRDSPIRTLDELLVRGRTLTLGIGDPRDHHKGLSPSGCLLVHEGPDALQVGTGANGGADRLTTRGKLAELRGGNVGIEELRDGARDRCRGHQEQVRFAGGFGEEPRPLFNAETMLLVDDDEAE